MTQIVIMPGGFHPFHAGHLALYQSARRAFPKADVYVAATDDTTTRPFPFPVKEKLAQLAGVDKGRFMRVKSPFRAEEITAPYNPEKDVLIFVRSEKDADKPPQAGGVKRDGSPSYLQPLQGQTRYEPFARHAYMAYLPTVEFGPGMTSATEIRNAWPRLNEKRKTALVMSLYPKTQGNAKLAATVVGLLDTAMGSGLDEDLSRRGFLKGMGAAAVSGAASSAIAAPFNHSQTVDPMTDKVQGENSTVVSDDGSGKLYIQWNSGVWFDLRQGLLGFSSVSSGFPLQLMRIKIGNSPVSDTVGTVSKNFKSMQIGGPDDTKQLASKILKHSGELRLEVLLANGNKKVFKFTIEQDAETSKFQKQDAVVQQKQQFTQQEKTKQSLETESSLIELEKKAQQKEEDLTAEINNTISKGDFYTGYQRVRDKQNKLMYFRDDLHKARQHKIIKGDWPDWLITYSKTKQLPAQWDNIFNESVNQGVAEAADKCPPATQDITLNLKNRQKAIDEYGYGPLNPDLPNTKFWMKKVDEWNLDSAEEAQQSLCGNCAAFDIRQETLDCIAQGIDSDAPEDAEGVIDAGELGYCKFLKFKCASRRTCDAWVTGGPLQDKPVDENQGWAATLEEKNQDKLDADPELQQAKRFAVQHYPEFSDDPDMAFDKWVQRSLEHGLEDDQKQFKMLQGVAEKIKRLEQAIAQARAQQSVVDESDYIEEKWSQKYKSSINCANPKGFSQKAHCAGRNK